MVELAYEGAMLFAPTFAIFLVLASVIAAPVLAADIDALQETTPEERAEAQTSMMKENLGLDDAKVQKVHAINLKYAKMMDPTIQGPDGPMMKRRVASNRQQQKDGELKAVLSADEYQKYLASKEEMRKHIVERIFEQRAKGGH
jgi:hypothetical protein